MPLFPCPHPSSPQHTAFISLCSQSTFLTWIHFTWLLPQAIHVASKVSWLNIWGTEFSDKKWTASSLANEHIYYTGRIMSLRQKCWAMSIKDFYSETTVFEDKSWTSFHSCPHFCIPLEKKNACLILKTSNGSKAGSKNMSALVRWLIIANTGIWVCCFHIARNRNGHVLQRGLRSLWILKQKLSPQGLCMNWLEKN